MPHDTAPAAAIAPDMGDDARLLYRIASVSTVLFVIVGMVISPIILNAIPYDPELAGLALIEHIGAHRLWWIWLQTLTMGSMVFVIVPLVALYPALGRANRVWGGIGILFAVICQVLFMAYFPVVNGLVWIADRYAETSDPAYRAALVGGAEALVAQNNVYGTSDGIFALSLIAIAVAMYRSPFPRWMAWLAGLSGVGGVVGAFLKPMLGIHYLWWWSGFTIWFLAIGWVFFRLGWQGRVPGRSRA